jgi:hypothetical protein
MPLIVTVGNALRGVSLTQSAFHGAPKDKRAVRRPQAITQARGRAGDRNWSFITMFMIIIIY